MNIGETLETTFADFFEISEAKGGIFEIETPDGWKVINLLLTKKSKECYLLRLEDGFELPCANTHLVLTKNGWKEVGILSANNHELILTKSGFKSIVAIEYLGCRDCFDVNISSDDNSYYSNGIVSHNSGKSLSAKATAKEYGMPLLRLDFGSLFQSYIGESERNARNAIKVAESVSPCVLGETEIEVNGEQTTAEKYFYASQPNRNMVTWRRIGKDFFKPASDGEMVKGFDPVVQQVVQIPLLGMIQRKAEGKKILRITTEDGNTISVTENHKLLVKNGDITVWKAASELINGDDLVSI